MGCFSTRLGSGDQERTSRANVIGTYKARSKILGFLTHGTKVRHAVMSRDWKSYTKPRSLRGHARRGQMLYVSRKIIKPGIKPRRIGEEIARRRQPIFQKRMQLVTLKAAGRLWR